MRVKKTNHQPIVDYYRGNEEFVKRLLDLMDRVERQQIPLVTPFLTEDLQVVCKQVIVNHYRFALDGGYEGAQLMRGVIAPLWYEDDLDAHIICLKGRYPGKYYSLSHRDVLGALMNLGITRDTLGDILVDDDCIYLFCSENIANYLMSEVHQIGRCKVSLAPSDEVITYQPKLTWHTEMISSMRLDTVVAAMTHLSRQKAQQCIQSGLVKLNHVPLEETTRICNNNDTVSIRGYGRFLIQDTMRKTQKGNYVVEIGKYC